MLGLGETTDEVLTVMQDLRDHQVNMLTLGQYLQPSRDHLPVDRFVTPREFDDLRRQGEAMASPMWPVARWYAPPITPTCRPIHYSIAISRSNR